MGAFLFYLKSLQDGIGASRRGTMLLTGLENKHADVYKGEMQVTSNRIHKMVKDRERFGISHDQYDVALILYGAVSEAEDIVAAVKTKNPVDINGDPIESSVVREELDVLAEDLRHLSSLARNTFASEPLNWNEDIVVDKTIPVTISLSQCLDRLEELANQMDQLRLNF